MLPLSHAASGNCLENALMPHRTTMHVGDPSTPRYSATTRPSFPGRYAQDDRLEIYDEPAMQSLLLSMNVIRPSMKMALILTSFAAQFGRCCRFAGSVVTIDAVFVLQIRTAMNAVALQASLRRSALQDVAGVSVGVAVSRVH
jgi:hypothetical protein